MSFSRLDQIHKPGWMLFAGLSLIQLMLIPPGIIVIDGISMFSVAQSLATDFDLSVPCDVSGYDAQRGLPANLEGATGRGGDCYSTWYPLISFVAAPFAWFGNQLGAAAGVNGENAAQVLSLIVPALASAGAGTLTGALALKLGGSWRGAVASALAFCLGTEALTYARSFFAETLSALLIALAVWGLTESGRRRQLGLAAIALAVLAKPQLGLVGPFLAGTLALQARSVRPAVAPLAATAAGGLLYMGYNWLRFADPLKFGGNARAADVGRYVDPQALVEYVGLASISPGRGVIWYSPVAVLGAVMVWRRRRDPVAALCIAGVLAVVVSYASTYYPEGGTEWGQRYFVAVLPLVCAGLALLRGMAVKVAVGLAVLGLITQIPTTVAFFDRTYADHRAKGVDLTNHRWSVSRSPVVSSWPAMVRQLRDARDTDVRDLAREDAVDEPPEAANARLLQVVALWWWLLPTVGIPWWLGAAGSIFGLIGGGLLVRAAARAA